MKKAICSILPIIHTFKTKKQIFDHLGISENYKLINDFIAENKLEHLFIEKLSTEEIENRVYSMSDEEFLNKYLETHNIKNLLNFLNLKNNSSARDIINKRFEKINYKIKNSFWSEIENNIIINNFNRISISDILDLLPGRTRISLLNHTRELGLKSDNQGMFNSKIQKLLDDSLETYYWIGFIMSDGHISHERNTLCIAIQKKDEQHLENFRQYVEANSRLTESRKGTVKISISNSKIMPLIIEKFNIHNRKTYNPPELSIYKKMSNDQFVAFFIGVIDGDGSISDSINGYCPLLRISCHYSWLKTFEYFSERLSEIFEHEVNKPYINSVNQTRWASQSILIIKKLKEFVLENKLPVLDRKWTKIKEQNLKVPQSKKPLIISFFEDGYTEKEISLKLGITKKYVHDTIYRYKKK